MQPTPMLGHLFVRLLLVKRMAVLVTLVLLPDVGEMGVVQIIAQALVVGGTLVGVMLVASLVAELMGA